jgi:alpha-beta hydrolase superfamily lysophospholipase
MSEVETLPSRDGTPLLVRRWPVTGEPWATILVVHGIGEHSGRHEATGGRFAAAGLHATSFDHRGFGASGGRRAFVNRWSIRDDIEDRLAASRRDSLPAAMYAHSLGGLLAADLPARWAAAPGRRRPLRPGTRNNVNLLLRAACRSSPRSFRR